MEAVDNLLNGNIVSRRLHKKDISDFNMPGFFVCPNHNGIPCRATCTRFLTETRFNHQKQTEYTVVFSTGEISQQQFNRYIDKCRAFSHDTLGVYVLTGEEYECGDPVFREVEGSL